MNIPEFKNLLLEKITESDKITDALSDEGYTIVVKMSDDTRFKVVINRLPSESRKRKKREIIKEFNKKYNQK